MSATFGSLFAGIGGLDLGLERAGWECRWQVENDAYCVRVLERHWPDVPRYGDVKELDPDVLEPVDLICGGFPCQPVSLVGRRQAQADDRWLWPEFARVLRGVRPRFALVENVPGLLVHGMGDVLGDLASLGFDAEWESIPAVAVGAPHLRYRVFVLAYAGRVGSQRHGGLGIVARSARTREGEASQRQRVWDAAGDRRAAVADAEGERCGALGANDSRKAWADHVARHAGQLPGTAAWPAEPDVGRVADGVPARVDRLRALGNAVVPQVAEWIGAQLLAAIGGGGVTWATQPTERQQ